MAEQNEILNNIRRKRRFNARISRIIAEVLRVNENDFNAETVIKGFNKADEIDILEIIIGVETEFDIQIPDNLFSEFKTVGDFYDYVRNATGGKNRSLN